MPIEIRPIVTLDDFVQVEDVQRETWRDSETQIVPRHLINVTAHSGGAVIGAFDGDRLVAFVFSFIGTDDSDPRRPAMTHLKHCSHMLAVLPEYRGFGLGYRLKLAQRDYVHQQGIRLITWTFDPLESKNAHLNITRLGSIATTYVIDAYGTMVDGLNAGLPSDRLLAEWWITSPRVRERLEGARAPLNLASFTSVGAPIANASVIAPDDGLPRPPASLTQPTGMFGLIEVPYDFQALKTYDAVLARDWRFAVRDAFSALFEGGYMVTDFFSEPYEGRLRSFYALAPRDS